MIDLKSRLDRRRAREMLSALLSRSRNLVAFSKHCNEEMGHDGLIANDLLNILVAGVIERQPEQDLGSGEWIYRVETRKIAVIFKFVKYQHDEACEIGIKLITCWRKP